MKNDIKSKVLAQIIFDGELDISQEEYSELVNKAREELETDNVAVRDWDRFVVIGDLHGDLEAAEIPVEYALKKGLPMVFLGDYVDRGDKQLETFAFILSLKLEMGEDVVLIRGNHESVRLNRSYGFLTSLMGEYSEDIYDDITSLYEKMPIASVVNSDYYFAHGGLAEDAATIEEINALEPMEETYNEILWNDPSEDTDTFAPNYLRGGYKLFGKKAFEDFISENGLSMVIRAHKCYEKGYHFFFDERLLSIFSVPNYCDNQYGKYAVIDGDEIELKDIQGEPEDAVPSF